MLDAGQIMRAIEEMTQNLLPHNKIDLPQDATRNYGKLNQFYELVVSDYHNV